MPRPKKIIILPAAAKKTAVLYCRVSSPEQRDGYSLDAQLDLLRSYAGQKGLEVVREIVADESAKDSGRKAFGEMLRLCNKGDATIIVVEKTDRLTRNMRDPVAIDELIQKRGLELHLVKESSVITRDSKASDVFVYNLNILLAKNYIDRLREEVKKGMREKARQGHWPGAAPIGYKTTSEGGRRVLMVDPLNAPIIRQLFDAYAAGKFSLKDGATYATSLGLKTRRGGKLSGSATQLILSNRLYYGLVKWAGEEFDGSHEPLVSRKLFDQAQAMMRGRNNAKVSNADVPVAYRGLFTCGGCGCNISPYIAKGKYVYYACTGAKGCKRSGVREEILTAAIAEKLQGLKIRPERMIWLRQALKDILNVQARDHDEAVKLLTDRRSEIQRRKRQAYIDRVDNRLALDTYTELLAEWETETSSIDKALRAFELTQAGHYDENLKLIELADRAFELFAVANSEERLQMLKPLLSNSTITAGKVEISLKSWFNSLFDSNVSEGEKDADEKWSALLVDLRTFAIAA